MVNLKFEMSFNRSIGIEFILLCTLEGFLPGLYGLT